MTIATAIVESSYQPLLIWGKRKVAVAFSDNLRETLETFGIAGNRLARYLDYDPSYISRILAGQRRPADLPAFIDGVTSYIVRNYGDDEGIAKAAALTGVSERDLHDARSLADAIKGFLETEDEPQQQNPVGGFLEKLDEFDLNAFMRDIKFDELKVPTTPFQLPTTKTYTGIEQMKQAEIDFLKAAVLARTTDDVILYSDMPLEQMAEDEEFPKKIMMGMALLIRKGIHLHNIHDVHRPLNELVMGLEGWIPVYMTGQISPYYLPHPTNEVFHHFLRSAGSVAVAGEAIEGNQGGGRYVVTKNAADVAYLRKRAKELLAHAKPLMRIYRENRMGELRRAIERLDAKTDAARMQVGEGTFANMNISVSPGSYALIEKTNAPQVSFLVEYPALVEALEHYEPTLF